MTQHKTPHGRWEPALRHLEVFEAMEIPEPPTLFDNYAGRTTAPAQHKMGIADHMGPHRLMFQYSSKFTPEQFKIFDGHFRPRNEAFEKLNLQGKARTRWNYQRYIKNYLRCVKAVDENVGRLLEYLDDNGLANNTVVIYSSDQGFWLGEHGWFDKRWMYEESLRTPMLVRWPGVIKPGSRNGDIVSPIDFAGTFCEVAGIETPDDLHGRSLVPVLKGKTPKDWRNSFYYHYYEYPGYHYVRRHYGVADGRYKLIHFYEDDVDQWELFDLKSDPTEMKSVYGQEGMAKIQKRLNKQLAMHRKKLKVPAEDPPQSVVKRLPPRTRKPTSPN